MLESLTSRQPAGAPVPVLTAVEGATPPPLRVPRGSAPLWAGPTPPHPPTTLSGTTSTPLAAQMCLCLTVKSSWPTST